MSLRLTKGFSWFLAQLDSPARAHAEHMAEEAAEEIAALPPGMDRGRAVHRRVSQLQEAFLQRRPDLAAQVRCGKGCSACCRVRVGVTADEAALLAGRVRGGVVIDRERLAQQAACPDAAAHFQLPLAEARCVLLGDDGACRVHEDRPSACRLVLVASDPAFCATTNLATQITAIIAPDAELLATAALSADPAQGEAAGLSLAAGLVQALGGAPTDPPA